MKPYTFAEYEENAVKTAEFKLEDPLLYCLMGMAGEAGETLEKAKKIARRNATYAISQFIKEDKAMIWDGLNWVRKETGRAQILTEMGDVLWYLSQSARLLGSSLAEVAQMNVEKLADRKERNVVVGEGDNR